jgi:hypothetical protein
MHHPSKHIVLKPKELEGIVKKTLDKQFPDENELKLFITFTLLKLASAGLLNPRLDVWLDDEINEFLITQYEEESKKDASGR